MDQKRLNKKRIPFNLKTVQKQKRYQFQYAYTIVPHPEKAHKGGEDAVFSSPNVLVVADGVSGWTALGIDAGLYAKKLTTIIGGLLQNKQKFYFYIEKPNQLAIEAVQLNYLPGSSTLSILTLHPQTGTLRSYNIGDSLFGLFKKQQRPILSKLGEIKFNTPMQVFGGQTLNSKQKIISQRQNNIKQNKFSSNTPIVSDVCRGTYDQFEYQQIKNSPIVLASDGLWDNIFVEQIHKELHNAQKFKNTTQYHQLQLKVSNLIKRIFYYEQIRDYESPFYKRALQNGLQSAKGSKIDDISIIVCQIKCQLVNISQIEGTRRWKTQSSQQFIHFNQ